MLGDNLLSLIKAYSYRNIPLDLVKHITKQVMQISCDPAVYERKIVCALHSVAYGRE